MTTPTSHSEIALRWEATPNPSSLKFVADHPLMDGTMEFATAQDAEKSPIASKLFGFPWTSRVMLGPDFITVTKQDWVDWDVLAEPLLGLIKEHLEMGLPLVLNPEDISAASFGEADDILETDSDIVKQIKAILARDIRPVVALDGGDISFGKYENGIVYLHMKGSCSGCPSSQATLKEGIEVRLKELLPEIKEVMSL